MTGRNPLEIDRDYDVTEDDDSLTLLQEQKYGTDPFNADTDEDGMNDDIEVAQWGTLNHNQVTNPKFSIAHFENETATPNKALDLSKMDVNGIEAPRADRFISKTGSYAAEAWFKMSSATSSRS